MITKKATLNQVIQDYIDESDDFYEAKDEFINDVNFIFKKKKDAGIMCKTRFKRAIEVFNDILKYG